MITIWSKQDLNKIEEQRKHKLLLYIVTSVIWLVIVVASLLLSNDNYAFNLIANIVLTIIFGWWSVYFFSISFAEVNALCKLQQGMDNATLRQEVLVFEGQKENRTRDGLSHCVYLFSSNNAKREVLSLCDNIEFVLGCKYLICTRKNIVVSYEVEK